MDWHFWELHKRVVEMDTKEPTQEFTPQQHKEWSGYRDILITAAEKVIDRGKQPVVWACHTVQKRCAKYRGDVEYWTKKLIWARQAQGVDEIKRKKERIELYAERVQRIQMEIKTRMGKQKSD